VDAAVEALCTLLDDVYQRIKADLAQTAVAAAGAAAVAPATPVHRMWGSMDLLSIDEGLVSALNGAARRGMVS
jgi:predicted naringenin-chalcone synthase